MLKIKDYLAHARECRRLAHTADDQKHRKALLRMAQTWADLAATRADTLKRKKRIATLEHDNKT